MKQMVLWYKNHLLATLYIHVNACLGLSNTLQHKIAFNTVEEISRNKGLGDGGLNATIYYDDDCQRLGCNDLQKSTSFVQVGDVGFVNNDEGLNCTPSSVTASNHM